VAAGELGEDPAGLGEADVGAVADGQAAEGLSDVAFCRRGWDVVAYKPASINYPRR